MDYELIIKNGYLLDILKDCKQIKYFFYKQYNKYLNFKNMSYNLCKNYNYNKNMENEKMLINATKFELEQLNQFTSTLKVNGLEKESKIKLIKLKIELSKIVKEIDEFRKTTVDSIKPDNYDELQQDLTENGKQKFEEAQKELNTKFQEIVVPFYNTLVSIEFEKLTPDEYFSLMAENDLPELAGYEYVYNLLVSE